METMQNPASSGYGGSSNLPGLTALRGLAAVLVVLFHIDVCLFYREMGTLLPKASSGVIANGYLWVDFFFILSGFVIHHAYSDRLSSGFRWRGMAAFYTARFFRIYPLHLALTLLLVLAVVVMGSWKPELRDGSWGAFFGWSNLPANLLLTHAMAPGSILSWNIVSWSIGAEWWVYGTAPLVIPALAARGRFAAVVCVGAGGAALVALYFFVGRDTLDITFDYGVFRCLGGFLIGLGLFSLVDKAKAMSAKAADILAALSIGGVLAVMHFDAIDLAAVPLFALLIVAGASPASAFSRLLEMPLLQFLGRVSYSIYLVHGLVFMMFWFGAPVFGLRFETPILAWTFAAVFLAATIAGSVVTHRFIEIPGQALGRRLVRSA